MSASVEQWRMLRLAEDSITLGVVPQHVLEGALEAARERMVNAVREHSLVAEIAAVGAWQRIASELAHRESVRSLNRMATRNKAARELARIRYASDDVEVDDPVDFVDGGAWVSARVFVDHDSIEAKIAAKVNPDA